MKKITGKQVRNTATTLASLLVGCLVTALGLVMFTVPNHIAPGGTSGLATSINAGVHLSVGILTWMLNLPVLIASIKILGIQAAIKTLVASTTLSVFMEILTPLMPAFTDNKLMAAVLGGILIGGGIGIAFLRGISMGGTDQLSILLGRIFPNFSTGFILMVCDGIVVIIAAITFRDLEVFLYSIICVFVASKTIDAVMDCMNHAHVYFIVTEKGQQIADKLNHITENGCTLMHAVGTYTGEDREVLMTVVHPNTAMQTLDTVKEIDPKAFTFMSSASEVHGKGFRHYRADA